jgi:hypothetical protein
LKNTLSNYFEVESPDDQVYSKQTRSIKQSKKQKGKQKNRTPGIERLIPDNDAKDVVVLIHTYKRGEVSNPLGVSLEAQT